MYKHRLSAINFLVTKRSDVRIRHDGCIAGRHKNTITEDDAKDAVQHAVASAKLEGVSLRKRFVDQLYQEALGQQTPSGKQRRAIKPQTHI
jgi:hypothetical protein